MNKLGEKIRRAMRLESAPIGFGPVVSRARIPSLLLMVHAPASRLRPPDDLTSKGVDAVLLSAANPEAEMGEVARWVKDAGDVPCGAQVLAPTAVEVAGLKEAGVDFLAFDAEATKAEALLETEMGYLLALSGEPSDSFLRAMEGFPLDGLWLYDWQGPLTVRRQMELRRLHVLSRMPLFVPVLADIAPSELRCLRDAGVAAVAVDGTNTDTWQRLAALRQAIDGLPPRVRRREERLEAVLPLTREIIPQAEEEEEEEDRLLQRPMTLT